MGLWLIVNLHGKLVGNGELCELSRYKKDEFSDDMERSSIFFYALNGLVVEYWTFMCIVPCSILGPETYNIVIGEINIDGLA